jgi:hypothetical protein
LETPSSNPPIELVDVGIIPVLPHQVADNWELIQTAASYALPPNLDYTGWEQLYSDLVRGGMWAYFIVGMSCGKKKALGIALLQPCMDTHSGLRTLHIWSLYCYRAMTSDQWVAAFEKIRAVAKTFGIKTITGITEEDVMIDVTRRLGGRVRNWVELEV